MGLAEEQKPQEKHDINHWARLAKNGTPEEKERAWERLVPFIEKLTERIAISLGSGKSVCKDLAQEAPGYILEKIEYFEGDKPFTSWVAVVLRNYLIDEFRKRIRQKRHETSAFQSPKAAYGEDSDEGTATVNLADLKPDLKSPDPAMAVCERADLSRAFSEEDLKILAEKLKPRPRVLALVIADLWRCVPPDRWQAWLSKSADLSESAPFPPEDLQDMDEPGSRIDFLAEYLGTSKASLRMLWHRAKPVLESLPWFKGLLDE